MFKIIHHTVTLPAPAEKLFEMYLDPIAHGAITGGPVTISRTGGSAFRAFDGMIAGKTLTVIPKSVIVQSWRGKDWKPEDRDSLLILSFLPGGDSGTIELVHLHVPEYDFEDVNKGWQKYYWGPWKEYLKRKQVAKKAA